MVDTKRKEEVSKSYLNAICAVKGISMSVQPHDDDGVDVVLQKTVCRTDNAKYGARIGVQLKSTASNYTESASEFLYPLKKKNYDDLRIPATVKSYLFLLILPKIEDEWVTHSIDKLVIKKCMYWLDLIGLPDNANSTSVTVKIPKTNIVSSEFLVETLNNIAEEELL